MINAGSCQDQDSSHQLLFINLFSAYHSDEFPFTHIARRYLLATIGLLKYYMGEIKTRPTAASITAFIEIHFNHIW